MAAYVRSNHHLSVESFGLSRRYALLYWTPLIIYHVLGESSKRNSDAMPIPEGLPGDTEESEGPSEVVVALLTALPFAMAAASTILNARHSKQTRTSSMIHGVECEVWKVRF